MLAGEVNFDTPVGNARRIPKVAWVLYSYPRGHVLVSNKEIIIPIIEVSYSESTCEHGPHFSLQTMTHIGLYVKYKVVSPLALSFRDRQATSPLSLSTCPNEIYKMTKEGGPHHPTITVPVLVRNTHRDDANSKDQSGVHARKTFDDGNPRIAHASSRAQLSPHSGRSHWNMWHRREYFLDSCSLSLTMPNSCTNIKPEASVQRQSLSLWHSGTNLLALSLRLDHL